MNYLSKKSKTVYKLIIKTTINCGLELRDCHKLLKKNNNISLINKIVTNNKFNNS